MKLDRLFAQIDSLFRQREIFGNTPASWLVALITLATVLIVLRLLKVFGARRARLTAERTNFPGWTVFYSLIEATTFWFLLLTSVYVAALLLNLPAKVQTTLRALEVTGLLVQVALWGNVALRVAMQSWVRRRMQHDPASAPFTTIVGYVGRVILWSCILLLILENLGIQVTALLTGVGIGGVAIALAVQSILSDLFASLSILVDKPFVIGDFIIVGDLMGTVDNIGLKTTRVRSLWGEQLIFPNNDLLQSRIRNFKRMDERRVLFKLGVTYDTPPEKLAALPGIVRDIIESQSPVRFDRAHFQGFGDSALTFEIVYFVLSSDYNRYMDVQQAINLELVRRCQAEEIDFARPTKTTYLQNPAQPTNAENEAAVKS